MYKCVHHQEKHIQEQYNHTKTEVGQGKNNFEGVLRMLKGLFQIALTTHAKHTHTTGQWEFLGMNPASSVGNLNSLSAHRTPFLNYFRNIVALLQMNGESTLKELSHL